MPINQGGGKVEFPKRKSCGRTSFAMLSLLATLVLTLFLTL